MEKMKSAAPVAVYGVSLGLLYSFSFWGRFSINPLQFASILDIAKIAAWPLSAMALMIPINLLVTGMGGDDWRVFSHSDNPILKLQNWIRVTTRLIFDGTAVMVLFWLIFEVSTPARWFGIGFCVGALGLKSIERQPFIRDLIPSYEVRFITIFLGILLPFFSLGAGGLAAEEIKAEKASLVLDEEQSSVPTSLTKGIPRQFAGTLGSSYVFYGSDKSVTFIKPSDGQAIALKPNPSKTSRFLF